MNKTNVEKLINLLSTAGWNIFQDDSSKRLVAEHLDRSNVVVLNKSDVICHVDMGEEINGE